MCDFWCKLMEFLVDPKLWVSIIALALSIAGIWYARVGAVAKTMKEFLDDYASAEMDEHLKLIRRYYEMNKDELRQMNQLALDSESPIPQSVKEAARAYVNNHERSLAPARRHINYFYEIAWRLRQRWYLPRWAFATICDTDGVDTLLSAVRPMSLAINYVVMCDEDDQLLRAKLGSYHWYSEIEQWNAKAGRLAGRAHVRLYLPRWLGGF